MPVDTQVLHTLYRDHHNWLQGWLRRRLGNGCDAADLVQDTFVRLLRAGNTASIREPRDYLATVARGLMVDFLRRRSLIHSLDEARPALAGLKVSGSFPLADTDRALAALEHSFPLRVVRRSDYWVTLVPKV